MRIVLLDSLASTPWHDGVHRLARLGAALTALGHAVETVDASRPEGPTILTGLPREGDARPLIEAVQAVRAVAPRAPDLCIAPLRGGLAHGLVMARACGELDPGLRIALLAEAPSRAEALRGDVLEHRLRPVVADALERACLLHADALLCAGETERALVATLGVALPPVLTIGAPGALAGDVMLRTGEGPVTDIVLLAPFQRAAGIVAILDALERLAARGAMAGRRLTIAGPMDEVDRAIGKTWLGRRATAWPFDFIVRETASFAEAFGHARKPGTLALLPQVPLALLDAHLPAARGTRVVPLAAGLAEARAVEAAAAEALADGRAPPPAPQPEAGPLAARLAPLLAPAVARAGAEAVACGLSLCILHRNRPALLALALDSVRAQRSADAAGPVEIVVMDNASTEPDALAMLRTLDAMPDVRVERIAAPVPIHEAATLMVEAARHAWVAFLDDDNVLAAGGLARLHRACARGQFDIVTSNLELFDGGPALQGGPTLATLAFIGPAQTAGLFFNAFGDTSMAVRREAFLAMGGFRPAPGPYPAPDWMFLAAAQAAGLRIGVLQTPAYRYRRDLHRQEVHWQKFDQHGIRQRLLEVYGEAFDPLLLARLAQSLALDYA